VNKTAAAAQLTNYILLHAYSRIQPQPPSAARAQTQIFFF